MQDTIKKMFEAGVHFGYSKSRRHPTTAKNVFGTKNGSDVIDLEKTVTQLATAKEFLKKLGQDKKAVLLVGAKAEARYTIAHKAAAFDLPVVSERWVGGILTNFTEIKKRLKKLEELKHDKETGVLEARYTKKERLLIDEKIAKMTRLFSGLLGMEKNPDALVVIDPRREHIAMAEAKMIGIPVVALANTDCDVSGIDYPIVGNDASVSSITFMAEELLNAYKEGRGNV